jgi:hypothetical protein
VLEVYYGFNAVYLRMFGTAKRDSMLAKLKQPGIEYYGQVGAAESRGRSVVGVDRMARGCARARACGRAHT